MFRLSALALALCACTNHDDTTAVRATFEAFQDSLFEGDAGALRRVLTRESRVVVDELPLERLRRQRRLEVTGIRGSQSRYEVAVVDPNADGDAGHYIVVREDGHLRVDLLATAALTIRERPAAGGPQVSPARFSPDEIDRIEAMARQRIR